MCIYRMRVEDKKKKKKKGKKNYRGRCLFKSSPIGIRPMIKATRKTIRDGGER